MFCFTYVHSIRTFFFFLSVSYRAPTCWCSIMFSSSAVSYLPFRDPPPPARLFFARTVELTRASLQSSGLQDADYIALYSAGKVILYAGFVHGIWL